MKVRATAEYEKRNIKDEGLDKIPKEGEVFEVSEERFNVLNGNNKYKIVFVTKIEEPTVEQNIIESKVEKAIKKRNNKKKGIK